MINKLLAVLAITTLNNASNVNTNNYEYKVSTIDNSLNYTTKYSYKMCDPYEIKTNTNYLLVFTPPEDYDSDIAIEIAAFIHTKPSDLKQMFSFQGTWTNLCHSYQEENYTLILDKFYLNFGVEYDRIQIYISDTLNVSLYEETSGGGGGDYQEGYNKGYEDGVNEGTESATGFDWLKSAVATIANVLNIEILPNIKVAYIVGIPLMIELILFILRFIK